MKLKYILTQHRIQPQHNDSEEGYSLSQGSDFELSKVNKLKRKRQCRRGSQKHRSSINKAYFKVRIEKNVFSYALQKMKRLAIKYPRFQQALIEKQFRQEMILKRDRQGKKFILIKLNQKNSKTEMVKMLSQIRRNFSYEEIMYLHHEFAESVKKSISFQQKNKEKIGVSKTIKEYEFILQLLEFILLSGTSLLELKQDGRLFLPKEKFSSYNAGTRSVQLKKNFNFFKEICDLLTNNWEEGIDFGQNSLTDKENVFKIEEDMPYTGQSPNGDIQNIQPPK